MNKFIFTLLIFLFSCASYNPEAIEALSSKQKSLSNINKELCQDFYEGAEAFKSGPEKAWPFLGRAREIDDMYVIMKKQGAACFEVESRDLSSELENRALEAFKLTWEEALRIVQ